MRGDHLTNKGLTNVGVPLNRKPESNFFPHFWLSFFRENFQTKNLQDLTCWTCKVFMFTFPFCFFSNL